MQSREAKAHLALKKAHPLDMNTRQEPRYRVRLEGEVPRLLRRNLAVNVVSVSRSGLGFVSEVEWRSKQKVKVSISFENLPVARLPDEVQVRGEIVHCRKLDSGHFYLGVQLEVPMEDKVFDVLEDFLIPYTREAS